MYLSSTYISLHRLYLYLYVSNNQNNINDANIYTKTPLLVRGDCGGDCGDVILSNAFFKLGLRFGSDVYYARYVIKGEKDIKKNHDYTILRQVFDMAREGGDDWVEDRFYKGKKIE